MEIYGKIRVGYNFATLKNFMTCYKNGIFCELVILVIFFKNLIC